jgi:hypothetical protein
MWGNVSIELRSPGLYAFLRDDNCWHAQFAQEVSTSAEEHAIAAVEHSPQGTAVKAFPSRPSVNPPRFGGMG